jgi:RNA polymerase sigma-70 factor (ECF subfamily)
MVKQRPSRVQAFDELAAPHKHDLYDYSVAARSNGGRPCGLANLPMETSVSLLERLRIQSDGDAWRRFCDLYQPLIRSWILRDATLREDAEDLVQEVMTVLARELVGFQRQHTGSFRCWLRTITVHRVKAFWRSRQARPRAAGGVAAESVLAQLADPRSSLSLLWDEEHDQHVMRRLLAMIEPEFEPRTWQAFRRVAFAAADTAEVAAELDMTVNAVLLAKSRILKRLREEAHGLID